jgi:hypothetical protein
MQAIQSFLIVVLCAFIWLTIMLSLVVGEEISIFDNGWRVKGRIQDGKSYEMSRQGAKAAKVSLCALSGFA